MDSRFDTQNLSWLEFENGKSWRELLLPSLPVLLVLHLFLGCFIGQHMAAPVWIRESRGRLLVSEKEIGPAVVVS